MSVTRITSIHCDGCGDWEYEDMIRPGARWLRRALRRAGWAVGLPGGKDYCPKCKKIAS